jgi:cysteinyl-tRNA synthetase
MHNGFLQVEGEKMSKSLGNFITINDLLRSDAFGGRSWSGEALRLAMLRTHYRQPIDWTVKALEEAESTLDRWYDAIGDVEPGEVAPSVEEALSDDLNTPAALGELHRVAHPAVAGSAMAGVTLADQQPAPALLKASANLLGLLQQTNSARKAQIDEANFLRLSSLETSAPTVAAHIDELIKQRIRARASKNWAESDRLRDRLAEMGVVVKDSKAGTTWEFKR